MPPMTPTLAAITCSAQMANWGISILLIQLCLGRLLDRWTGRKLPSQGKPLKPTTAGYLIALGLLLSVAQAIPYTMRLTHHLWRWSAIDQRRAMCLIGFWMYGAARIVVIHALAYHRRRKMIWCAGWVITSHIIILGALWTQIP